MFAVGYSGRVPRGYNRFDDRQTSSCGRSSVRPREDAHGDGPAAGDRASVALRAEEEKPAEAVAAEAATAAEPEVIKKGKKETEEGEEGAAEAKPEKKK